MCLCLVSVLCQVFQIWVRSANSSGGVSFFTNPKKFYFKMTTVQTFQGYAQERNTSRVLAPPGGRSSFSFSDGSQPEPVASRTSAVACQSARNKVTLITDFFLVYVLFYYLCVRNASPDPNEPSPPSSRLPNPCPLPALPLPLLPAHLLSIVPARATALPSPLAAAPATSSDKHTVFLTIAGS